MKWIAAAVVLLFATPAAAQTKCCLQHAPSDVRGLTSSPYEVRALGTKAIDCAGELTWPLSPSDFSLFSDDGSRLVWLRYYQTGHTQKLLWADMATFWAATGTCEQWVHEFPTGTLHNNRPVWAQGSNTILYEIDHTRGKLIKIDLSGAGSVTDWVDLPAATNVTHGAMICIEGGVYDNGSSVYGWTTDGKLVFWPDSDDQCPEHHLIDVVNRTVGAYQTDLPTRWGATWLTYPSMWDAHQSKTYDLQGVIEPNPVPTGYQTNAAQWQPSESVVYQWYGLLRIFERMTAFASNHLYVGSTIERASLPKAHGNAAAGEGSLVAMLPDTGEAVKILDLNIDGDQTDPNSGWSCWDTYPVISPNGGWLFYMSRGASACVKNPYAAQPGYVAKLAQVNQTGWQTIDSFDSSLGRTAASGDPVTLTWATTGSTTVYLDGVSVATSGSQVVNPTATHTYELTARGTGPVASKRLSVEVVPDTSYNLLTNGSFESGETGWSYNSGAGSQTKSVITGQHWDGTHAYSITQDTNVQVDVYTSYTNATTLQGKTVVAKARVKSAETQGNAGCYTSFGSLFFTYRDASNNLNYAWGGECYIEPGGWQVWTAIKTMPSSMAGPTLTVYVRPHGQGGSATLGKTAYIDGVELYDAAVGPPARVNWLTASPLLIHAGDTVRLEWDTSNATAVSISPQPGAVISDMEVLDTPYPYWWVRHGLALHRGSFVLGGDYPAPTETTTYTITASGGGVDATASVTVSVMP